jgi:hypothetical protein
LKLAIFSTISTISVRIPCVQRAFTAWQAGVDMQQASIAYGATSIQ